MQNPDKFGRTHTAYVTITELTVFDSCFDAANPLRHNTLGAALQIFPFSQVQENEKYLLLWTWASKVFVAHFTIGKTIIIVLNKIGNKFYNLTDYPNFGQ